MKVPYRDGCAHAVVAIAVMAAWFVSLFFHGCQLHESPIGHRIDQQPVITIPHVSKPDDDGGSRPAHR